MSILKNILSCRSDFSPTFPLCLLALLIMISPLAFAAEPRVKRPPERENPEVPDSVRAERALLKKPNDRTARLEAARAHLAEGADSQSRVEAAQQHAVAVLQEHPNDVEALLLAGQTSLLEKDATTAARYYRAATAADANNASAFLGLGDALSRLGDEAGATTAFARYRALMGMPPLKTESTGK